MDKNQQNSLQHLFKTTGANRLSILVLFIGVTAFWIVYSLGNRDIALFLSAVVPVLGAVVILSGKWKKND
jgi:membrane associated rhomboid family serine protease